MNKRAIGLVALLGVVAAAGLYQLKSRKDSTPGEPRSAEARPTPAPTPIPVSAPTVRRLVDGSFNPNPPVKPKFDASPAGMPELSGWRERYRPILASRSSVGPRLYAYPFLDRTKHGVGLVSTYGSHLSTSAALTLWTDARAVGGVIPERYGVPRADPDRAEIAPTLDEWLAQARSDPATAEAEHLIVGVFEDYIRNEIKLTVRLYPRDGSNPAEPKILYEERMIGGTAGMRGELERIQRRMLKGVTEKLVADRVVARRIGSPPMQLDLEKELSEVAVLLDANDSWAAMEGIDRALYLAPLFHQDTLPLQAAAYGQAMLAKMMFQYPFEHHGVYEHALRAHALAQVAMAMDEAPWLSRLAHGMARDMLKQDRAEIVGEFQSPDYSKMPPEFAAIRHALADRLDPIDAVEVLPHLPDWQFLIVEKRQSFMVETSILRDFFNERYPQWSKRDFFTSAAALRGRYDNYLPNRMLLRTTNSEAAALSARMSVASEIASLLLALNGSREFSSLLEATLAAGTADVNALRDAAAQGDFHRARETLLAAFSQWPAPSTPGHPGIRLLAAATPAVEKTLGDPAMRRADSGLADFEYTAAERVRFYRWLDSTGPNVEASFQKNFLGSLDGILFSAGPYLGARPDNSAMQADIADYLNGFQSSDERVGQWMIDALETAEALFPPDPERSYHLGRNLFSRGETRRGRTYLSAYNRNEPFALERLLKMAELCARYGYNADALDFYDRYVELFPNNHRARNARNFLRCNLGREAEFREKMKIEFGEGPAKLTGNTALHKENLRYLIHWARDYDAAERAARTLAAMNPYTGLVELAAVEFARSGDARKAAEHLRAIDFNRPQSDLITMATTSAAVAQLLLDFGLPDEADPHVQRAASIDDWRGATIVAMAELAVARKDYRRALAEYERFMGRYGQNEDVRIRVAAVHGAMGDYNSAIVILEAEVFDKEPQWVTSVSAAELMKLYAESGRSARARELADRAVNCALRDRKSMTELIEAYRRIDAGRAEAMLGRLNEIMAGPRLFTP